MLFGAKPLCLLLLAPACVAFTGHGLPKRSKSNAHLPPQTPQIQQVVKSHTLQLVVGLPDEGARLKGFEQVKLHSTASEVEVLLSAAAADADVLSREEIIEYLTRLARCTKVKGKVPLKGDWRMEAILRRIEVLADAAPLLWVPNVLGLLAKCAVPAKGACGALEALARRADQGLKHLSPVNLCTVAFSFSRLRFTPSGGAAFWRRFIECCSNRLLDFSPWELSTLLRSLTTQSTPFGTFLDPTFLGLHIKCAQRRLLDFGHGELEALAASLAKLSSYWRPSPQFLDGMVMHSMTCIESFRPLGLARFLHALSRMDHDPGSPFMARFEERCIETAPYWDEGAIALGLQAFVWFRAQPTKAMMQALLERARTLLKENKMNGLNLGTTLMSLAELRKCPDDAWMATFIAAAKAQLSSMGGKDLSYTLKGLSLMNYHPGDEEFLDILLRRLEPFLGTFNGVDLQFTITGFVGLSYTPPTSFLASFERSVLAQLPQIRARDLSLILWSYAALDLPRQSSFIMQLLHAAREQLERESPAWASLATAGEQWPTLARLRQLRQVVVHMIQNDEDRGDLRKALPPLLPLVEKGLRAVTNDDLVRSKASVSNFHVEVRDLLESMGAELEPQQVDLFILDLCLKPKAGRQQRPLVLLLHGPSRFIRNVPTPRLEAGTAFKERMLRKERKRFAGVASLSHLEWNDVQTREGRVELLRTKLAELGLGLDDFMQVGDKV